MRNRPWLVMFIVFTLVAAVGFFRVEQISNRQERDIECISKWADEYSSRSEIWRSKLDDMLRAANNPDRSIVEEKYRQFIEASTALPDSPRLACQ